MYDIVVSANMDVFGDIYIYIYAHCLMEQTS